MGGFPARVIDHAASDNAAPVSCLAAPAQRDERLERDLGLWFETAAQAWERARTGRAAGNAFVHALERLGADRVALVSHRGPSSCGAWSVLAHNWNKNQIALLLEDNALGLNPIFGACARGFDWIDWASPCLRARLNGAERGWLQRLEASGVPPGLAQQVKGALAPTSCLLSGVGLDEARLRWAMRAAQGAYAAIVSLQRPRPIQRDRLTAREHECLSLAIFEGLRPREVAATLNVSINTVRTMRQSACARLGARSQEEAVWRMIENGQAFGCGRASRARTW